MSLDILMTILSVILMGGTILFPDGRIHQILGMSLLVLWALHITLNRRWYASLAKASKLIISTNANERSEYGAIPKGKYNARRIMQTAINCGILICTVLLMISGLTSSFRILRQRTWLTRQSTAILPQKQMPR